MITVTNNDFQTLENAKTLAHQIMDLVMEHINILGDQEQPFFGYNIHFDKLVHFIAEGKKIQLVLPAFPAKSSNNEKTSGTLPDLGEVLSLQNLNKLCEKITEIYQHGAEIVICSDGRVFSDLVQVSDEDVDHYAQEIKNIIAEFNLEHLTTYNLEDVFSTISYDEMRAKLVDEYASDVSEIREGVKSDLTTKQLFNGIHRFVFEDRLALDKEHSKNFIRKESKKIAYEVIQRSNAWSNLVEEIFPQAMRLSIHPQHLASKKLGIKLLDCRDNWGTPWHNVVLFDGYSYKLVKKREALAAGAREEKLFGKYTFFVLEQKQVA